jgi:hypothetical protein
MLGGRRSQGKVWPAPAYYNLSPIEEISRAQKVISDMMQNLGNSTVLESKKRGVDPPRPPDPFKELENSLPPDSSIQGQDHHVEDRFKNLETDDGRDTSTERDREDSKGSGSGNS